VNHHDDLKERVRKRLALLEALEAEEKLFEKVAGQVRVR